MGTTASVTACVPDVFSRRTREGIEKGVITRGQRVEIINVLAHRMLSHTEFPSSAEYSGVCQALITKYPTLKDTIRNGYVSTQSIQFCCSNNTLVINVRGRGKYNSEINSKTSGESPYHHLPLHQSRLVLKISANIKR